MRAPEERGANYPSSLNQFSLGDLMAADESFDGRGIGLRIHERLTTRSRRHGGLGREESLLSELFFPGVDPSSKQHLGQRLLVSELQLLVSA